MKYRTYKKSPKKVVSIIFAVILGILSVPVLFTMGVMFYCNNFLEYYPISGVSMQPLLNPNGVNEDYVYIERGYKNLNYDDIIIYSRTLADNTTRLIIKRVIALAGDNVMIKKNQDDEYRLYIQYQSAGEFVEKDEEFIADKSVYSRMYTEFYLEGSGKTFDKDADDNRFLHIEENQVFYLGDNRTSSTDCLDYGAQSCDKIIGEVKFIIHKNEQRVWQVVLQVLGINKWK